MILEYKMRFSRSGLNFVLLSAGAVCFFAMAIWLLGFRINLTPSMVVGIWKITPFSTPNGLGQVVIVEKDAVPLGGQHQGKYDLLKRVVGIAGDKVTYDGESVWVNDCKIGGSRIFLVDGRGKSLPQIAYPLVIPDGHVWLSSDNVFGYDSRYYGPVNVKAIRHGAILLWGIER